MIDIYKKEVLEYLEKNNISYVEDSTNSKNDYTRNKIRNVIFPYIENEMGYNLQKSFITLSKTIREEEAFLDDYIKEIILKKCNFDNENNPKYISINMEKLIEIYEIDFKYKKGMLKRFIITLIEDITGSFKDFSNTNIEDITTLILKNVGNKKIIINGLEFGIKNKKFYISKYE
jgi:tRNA(ile)-lysidine synthase